MKSFIESVKAKLSALRQRFTNWLHHGDTVKAEPVAPAEPPSDGGAT